MKKILSLFLVLVMVVAVSIGCAKTNDKDTETTTVPNEDTTEVRVLVISGPTGMGMAKLINDEKENDKYKFDIYSKPTDVVAEIMRGDYDIAALPTNLAANLFNKTEKKLQVAAINTLGVLYIIEDGNTITDIKSLEGKTIYTAEEGATPEYVLRHILKENNVNANIEFLSSFDEVSSRMVAGDVSIAMLPEPKLTATKAQKASLNIALNLTEEWKKVSDSELVQGCIVVRKEFAQKHKAALDAFLAKYEQSINFVNSNPDEASQMIAEIGIIPNAGLAKNAIPRSNIVYIDGSDLKTNLNPFLQVLFEANANSIGGSVPGNDFYYTK